MLAAGLIVFIVGVIAALGWRRDIGIALAVIGAVLAIVALLSGGSVAI